jgi:hypothetical protein
LPTQADFGQLGVEHLQLLARCAPQYALGTQYALLLLRRRLQLGQPLPRDG